jgi:hypothetical protein
MRFMGSLVAEATSLPPDDVPAGKKAGPAFKRYFVLRVYTPATMPPKHLGVILFNSVYPNEPQQTFAELFDSRQEMFRWFREFDPCGPAIWKWVPWNENGAEKRVRQVQEVIAAWYRSAVAELSSACEPPEDLT